MALCGCYNGCACQLQAGNDLITVSGDGDTLTGGWSINGVETPFLAASISGAIEITPAGPYGHTPTFDFKTKDTGTVALSVGGDGLEAHVITVPSNNPDGTGGVLPGMIMLWATDTAPDGWVFISGPTRTSKLNQFSYPILHALYGTMFGAYDGDDFMLPDWSDRVVVGQGSSFGTLGGTTGALSTTLTSSHIPQHNHAVNPPSTAVTGSGSVDPAIVNTSSVDPAITVSLAQAEYFVTVPTAVQGDIDWVYIPAYDDSASAASAVSGEDGVLRTYAKTDHASSPNIDWSLGALDDLIGGTPNTATQISADQSTHFHTVDIPATSVSAGTFAVDIGSFNSGNYGTASPTAVSAVQPSVVANYILKIG